MRRPSRLSAWRQFSEAPMRGLSRGGEGRLGGADGARQRHGAGDDPAAEHARLARRGLIEHAGLSGRHAVFTLDQLDFKTIGVAAEPSGLWGARRADLDMDFGMIADRFLDCAIAEPVYVAEPNATGPQRFARADQYAARRRVETYDIEWGTGGDAKPPPLTDSEVNNAVMAAEHAAIQIDDLAGSGGARTQPFDHIGITAVWHETDVLAVLFVGDREAEAAGQIAGLRFRAIAQWKTQQIELRARRREQEIALIALGLAGAVERAAPVGQPARRHIVAGCQYCSAEFARSHQEIAKFDRLVALDARHRGLTGHIALGEPVDDRLFEALLVVEHVMGNADPSGHRPGIVNVAAGAAGTFAMGRCAMVVELERDADDVIALLGQQRRRYRGIDAARHCHNHPRLRGRSFEIERVQGHRSRHRKGNVLRRSIFVSYGPQAKHGAKKGPKHAAKCG